MRHFVLVTALTFVQALAPTPAKTQTGTADKPSPSRTSTSKSSGQNQSPTGSQPSLKITDMPPVKVTELPSVTVVSPKRDWVDWGYWLFNLLLVCVGGFQVYLLWKTLTAVQRQGNLMKRQADKLDESVAIADKAANAALLNAQAAVAAARPWVSFFGEYNAGIFTFKAANLGNTPADVVSYSSGMMLVDRVENLPIPPNYGQDRTPSLALLTPTQMSDGPNITVETYDTNCIAAPDPKKQVLAFFFRVIYKNPLSNTNNPLIPQHESRMCFWYDKKGSRFPQAGGPQEYNRHT
jgi:hypothetical protein